MKSIPPLSASLLLGAGLFLLAPAAQADETFRGKIRLRGSVQSEAKPSSLSFVISGRLTSRESNDVATVTGGGLFRSKSNTIVHTTFTGPLKVNINLGGDMTREREHARVRVSRRYIRFPGGRVRLDRPIDPGISAKQRIKGRGYYRYTFK